MTIADIDDEVVRADGLAVLQQRFADGPPVAVAQLLGMDGQTWRLRVERETLRTNALRDKLLAVLEPVLGAGARIELEAGAVEDSIARREAAEREAAQREAEQVIRNDPAVGALMAQFRTARIVPGSIKPL